MNSLLCYCGSTKNFQDCCGKFINKIALPQTAEELMRSRYSAFCIKDFNYIIDTHDPKTQHNFDLLGNQKWADTVQFTGLKVLQFKQYGDKAKVEFEAYFISQGQAQTHRELSWFRKISGRWYYTVS